MAKPSRQQLDLAIKLGLPIGNRSAQQLQDAIGIERKRLTRLKFYIKLRNVLVELGGEPPQGATMAELKELIRAALERQLHEKGVVKDAVIHVTHGVFLTQHGKALVTKGVVNIVGDMFTISLRFGSRRPNTFNAFTVLRHAQVVG